MSILIKGMDVQNCKECPCCVDYGDPYFYTEYVCNALDLKNSEPCDIPDDREGRLPNCPLVNVPTPHGRLIDADRLLALVEKEVNNTCIGCEPEPDDCCAYDRFKEIISEIKTAQTIIEAEVSE